MHPESRSWSAKRRRRSLPNNASAYSTRLAAETLERGRSFQRTLAEIRALPETDWDES